MESRRENCLYCSRGGKQDGEQRDEATRRKERKDENYEEKQVQDGVCFFFFVGEKQDTENRAENLKDTESERRGHRDF